MSVLGNSGKTRSTRQWNLHGPPGAGKTTAAVLASLQCPESSKLEERNRKSRKILIEDLVYVGYDLGGLDGFREMNIDLAHSVDVRELLAHKKATDILDAQNQIVDSIFGVVEKQNAGNKRGIVGVILDTVTRFDSLAVGWLEDDPDFENDKWGMYRAVKKMHIQQLTDLQLLPNVHLMTLFHSKAMMPVDDNKADRKKANKAKQDLVKLGDQEVAVIPSMTGDALTTYTGDCTMEFFVSPIAIPGAPGKYERVMYGYNTKGRGKSRLERTFQGKEVPASMGYVLDQMGWR